MAKRESFWTPERLKELRKLSRTMSVEQIASQLQRHPHDVQQAIRYEQNIRRLKMPSIRERINGKIITIRRFAVEFAEGAKHTPVIRGSQDLY